MRPIFVLRQQSFQMYFSFYILRRGAVGSTFASHSRGPNSALTVVTLTAGFRGFSSASVQCRYNVSDYTRAAYTHSLTSSCFD